MPKASAAVAVPNAAITDRGKGPGVWVLDQNSSTISFRPVKIFRIGQEDAYLENGVRPGEQIVALGAHLLTEGQRVRVADKETASR
jgi:multidrug efflux pump subunit AcrA (membrane-fusion protein)